MTSADTSPSLAELARRLRANGMVVVPTRDYLEIRLSLFASVRVSIVDGQLVCEPRFGFVARERATWATLIGIAALTATAFLDFGITPVSAMLGFLGVSSSASTAIRYMLTESCITRVQTAYMLMTEAAAQRLTASEARRALPEPAVRPTTPRPDIVSVKRTEH